MDWFSWLSKTDLDPTLSYEYGLVLARNKLRRDDLTHFDHGFLQSMGISVAKHRLEILKLARKEKLAGAGGEGKKGWMKIFWVFEKTANRFKNWVFYRRDFAAVEPVKEEEKKKEERKPVAEPARPAGRRIQPPPSRDGAFVAGKLVGESFQKKLVGEKVLGRERLPVIKTRRIAKSGPLDRRSALVHDKRVLANRSLKLSGPLDRSSKLSGPLDRRLNLSGPLDRSVQERLVLAYRSPVVSGPLDGRGGGGNERLRLSGPLNGRTPSPRVYRDNKERERIEKDDHTLWAALFQELKPT